MHPGSNETALTLVALKVIQTNLTTVFTLCQAAGQHMVPRRQGKIINFASLLTFQGGYTVPAYAAAKGTVPESHDWGQYLNNMNYRGIGTADEGTLE